MYRWFFAMAMAFLMTAVIDPGIIIAQVGGGGGGDGGGAATGGIEVDASGVLRTRMTADLSGRVDRQRIAAAKAKLNRDLQTPSTLRKVSLKRLEAAVMAAQNKGEGLTEDILNLAGLTRITNVFFFPEEGEIIIAGPAEGFYRNSQNHVVGIESEEPTIQLEDLVVALRAFGPNRKPTGVISVSIDPTAEGSARFSQAFDQLRLNPQAIRGNEGRIAEALKQAMGPQTITIQGISPKTRFAQVMTEADYRMKLIGMGLERPPVQINNYVDHMPMVANNALNRWYFQPKYECVAVGADQDSMELRDGGVELVAEQDRWVNGQKQENVGGANKAARNFAASFTKRYDQLSKKMSLYGELRNLIDLTVVAAFIQERDLYEKAGWSMNYLGDETNFVTERFNAPTSVEPVINAIWRDGAFSTPIGGGVNIQAHVSVRQDKLLRDDTGDVQEKKAAIQFDNLADGQWWWD